MREKEGKVLESEEEEEESNLDLDPRHRDMVMNSGRLKE